jgi:hypothetical protein
LLDLPPGLRASQLPLALLLLFVLPPTMLQVSA